MYPIMRKNRIMTILLSYSKLFVLSLLVLASCKHDELDGKYYGKKYCDCMQENIKTYDFLQARTICDGELIKENRLFRIVYIEENYGRYMTFLPKSTKDSVVAFNHEFLNFLEGYCCKEAVMGCDKSDSLQLKRKSLDTIQFKY